MKLKSPAFENYELIPRKYTCEGENINPPLEILDVPIETKSLVLTMVGPNALEGQFTHWLVWNIKPETKEIYKDSVPEGAVVGKNSLNKNKYVGPCPPASTHVYVFKLCAIDIVLPANNRWGKEDIKKMIRGHVIKKTILRGYYERGD